MNTNLKNIKIKRQKSCRNRSAVNSPYIDYSVYFGFKIHIYTRVYTINFVCWRSVMRWRCLVYPNANARSPWINHVLATSSLIHNLLCSWNNVNAIVPILLLVVYQKEFIWRKKRRQKEIFVGKGGKLAQCQGPVLSLLSWKWWRKQLLKNDWHLFIWNKSL